MLRYFFSIPMFNILFGVSLISSILMFQYLCKREQIPAKCSDNMLLVIIISLLTAIVSSVAFDNLVHNNFALTNIWEFLSGMTFYGGLIGGAVVASIGLLFVIKDRDMRCKMANILIICVVLGHAFGRLGCFFGGCCYGIETDSVLGLPFPLYDRYGYIISHEKRLPTQLFESGFLFALFIILFKKINNAIIKYVISYGLFRFLLEFIRGDNRGEFITDVLSPSQLISLLLVIIGIFLIIWRRTSIKQA